jgi:hypothetical protein
MPSMPTKVIEQEEIYSQARVCYIIYEWATITNIMITITNTIIIKTKATKKKQKKQNQKQKK